MMLLSSSLNLIIVFIALELMSVSVYVLVGFRRNDRRSNEASVKYYILGSAASAILLYGAALLYGATTSVDMGEIAQRVAQGGAGLNPLVLLGILCVLVGFLFKIASVPFHMWMPDVYDGAPTPITGFMTTGLKAAVFISLVRVMASLTTVGALPQPALDSLHHVLWISALLTMLIGNLIALQQTNLKRMLAYSSIAHSGYLLVGLLAGLQSPEGYAAVFFYIVVYALMNVGAFAVLSVLSQSGDSGLELSDISGLSEKHPWLSFALAVFLFSMAGLPPTAGFTAKYALFYSAIQTGEVWLVVLAVLCSTIAAYYYLRVLVYLYMKEPVGQGSAAPLVFSKGATLTLALTVALVLKLGVLPSAALQKVNGLFKTAPPQNTVSTEVP
jgi:NADH-quinone oxidoreductase subunit N